MLTTNYESLRAEIMDVIRLFDAEGEDFTHYFSFSDGNFFNAIEYNGTFYDYENEQKVENDLEFKRYARRFAKLAFYEMLSKVKNIELPYGALTGIRPTKLAYMEMSAGRDYKQLFNEMHVTERNISLVERVLECQQKVYANKGGQDLFISLPFCPSKCQYCSFITAPISATKQYVDDYIICLNKELESVKGFLTNLKSIYIGGGTPFAIQTNQLERVYAAVKALSLPQVEYTVEAGRPDVFSEDKLRLSKDYGVTRICINPQSFSNSTLEKIGRKHTEKDVYSAFEMAEKYNFDVNLDLIAGLADETPQDFELSLKKAIELNPANITVHTLSLKSGAKLKENCNRLHIDGIGKMIDISRELLTQAGYEPYYMYRQKYQAGGHENCGWAKKGKECVYNIDVMEEIADNIAVGANAISKKLFSEEDRIERCASPKDVKTYIEKVDKIISDRNNLFNTTK
jgi:oxygen-independent coproporphyrinogen-3 oxidase